MASMVKNDQKLLQQQLINDNVDLRKMVTEPNLCSTILTLSVLTAIFQVDLS